MTRQLRWPEAANVRDLGDLPAADRRRTRAGALVRADSLCRLTREGRDALLAHGVRTVIDMRIPDEIDGDGHPEACLAHTAVTYLHLIQQTRETWEGMRALGTRAEKDVFALEHCRERIGRIVTAIAGAAPGGVVFHCVAGKDRTGIVTTLLLRLASVTPEAILEDYLASDEALRPLMEEAIAKHDDPLEQERVRRAWLCDPGVPHAILAHLETRYGGPERYLLAAGVSASDVARVRERLLD